MRNFQVRSDGPPDNEWFGSFDGFQTEFSISQLVEEKFTEGRTSAGVAPTTATGTPLFDHGAYAIAPNFKK